MKQIGTCNIVKLLVTEKCNMNCPYCNKNMDNGNEISLSQIEVLLRKFHAIGYNKVKISGGMYGEPLLRNDITDIIKISNSIGYKEIGLATNGILLTEKLLNDYIDNGLTWITLSINTLNEQTYEQLYSSKMNLSILDLLKYSEKLDRFQINCILLKDYNINEVENIIEFGHKNGVVVQFMELVENNYNKAFFSKHFFPADTIKEQTFKKSTEYYFNKSEWRHQYQLESGIVSFKQGKLEDITCKSCERLFVSSSGKVFFCKKNYEIFNYNDIDNLNQQNLRELVTSKKESFVNDKLTGDINIDRPCVD